MLMTRCKVAAPTVGASYINVLLRKDGSVSILLQCTDFRSDRV